MNSGKSRKIQIDSGSRYGKLSVIRECSIEERPANDKGHVYYSCSCDCGSNKIVKVKTSDLRRKHTISCGCSKKSTGTKNLQRWRDKGGENTNRQFVGELSGTVWCRVISNAKERNLKVNITQKYAWDLFLKQNKKCALTGLDLILSPLSKDKTNNTASLDRIDSNNDYTEGNVQWVHKDVNLMKLYFSEDYFKRICKLVTENNK